MREQIRALWQDESGQDLTEYALLIVLVALAAVASMKALARAISTVYSNTATNITTNT
jgi:pilus assembly protein Flp/PilA